MSTFTITIHHKGKILTKNVSKDSFTVGRSSECDILLNDTPVSRVHLVVSRRGKQIWIEDKNSSNGTFVNGMHILQGTPVNVSASDKIQLGKSEFMFFISATVEEKPLSVKAKFLEPPSDTEPIAIPAVEEAMVIPPVVMSQPIPKSIPQPISQPISAPTSPTEKVLYEARRKAAQIVLEGEAQAEKRVQAIYEKAREEQVQSEAFYQSRIAAAHKEADEILADCQQQSQLLLQEARGLAQGVREEVDGYVQGLKEKAQSDADKIIADATLQIEALKAETIKAAQAKAELEIEELFKKSQEEAHNLIADSKQQLLQNQEKIKDDEETLANFEKTLSEAREQLHKVQAILETTRTENLDLEKKIVEKSGQFDLATKTCQEISAAQKKLEEEQQKLQEKQAHLSMDIHDLEAKKSQLSKEYDGQKILLHEKLEQEKEKTLNAEKEYLEISRAEISKRQQKMEQELLDDVIRKKMTLVKEIHSLVEREIVISIEPEKWNVISGQVASRIQEAIDTRVASLSQSSHSTTKPVNLSKKRSAEKMQWATMGLMAGAFLLFVGQVAIEKVRANRSPLRAMAATEAQDRQADLERRKFNPPQTEELKDSYTDAVIYTRNFVDIYLDNEFQKKLYKATASYLLKTWRIDEDRSLQVVSASNAMVKELIEKKAKIHPDFIKEGLAKMHGFETETLSRMKNLLGSEVRLESYRRFEQKFYRDEVQRRKMAQH